MNTAEVATELGTTAKILRRFLRSGQSTFTAVGSGGRYEFDAEDMPTLKARFAEWNNTDPRTPAKLSSSHPVAVTRKARKRTQVDKDREVWNEEGPVSLPDIRNPRVRARVLADAAAREARLEARLLAVGLHITQWGNR